MQRPTSTVRKTARSFYNTHFEPFHPLLNKTPKWTTPKEAVSQIESGMKVFIHSACAAPSLLVKELADHALEVGKEDISLFHIHTEGFLPVSPEYDGVFHDHSLFIGSNARKAVNDGRADYIPAFLGDIPSLFRDEKLELNAALMQVSPPDKHGFVSLGVSVDVSRAAVSRSEFLVGLVNPNMPRTHGDGHVHVSHFDYLVESNSPLIENEPAAETEVNNKIGAIIAEVIEDGSTLQMGIGAIPDAVLRQLHGHKDLGVHTEMFSDGIVDLYNSGAITNANKTFIPGHLVSSFCMGTRKTYDFVDDNPFVSMLDCSLVNDTHLIKQNPKVVAINSAIEVDLTGQVVSDSIGTRMYSGVGGQIDFIRGAALSEGGKPILAFPSTTSKGRSRITPFVQEGAGIVTTRAHVHYVATEYGIRDLSGKSLRDRARALIEIAHPDHREDLERAAHERWHRM